MKQSDNFSFYLTKFMTEYLPGQRSLSTNTIRSYRDTFVQLIVYCRDTKHIQPDKLKISSLTRDLIEEFLTNIEVERKCSVATRNQRLAAIKSFIHFVQVEEPEHLLQCQSILELKGKTAVKTTINYLSSDEINLLLNCPDSFTTKGRRDIALLTLLYDSAARVQELCDIKLGDIRLDSPPVLQVTGKGKKKRRIPLSPDCADILRKYVAENNLDRKGLSEQYLFFNNRNEPLTRSGVSHILKKYLTKLYEEGKLKSNVDITPHCLRHSKAMHLVEAGVNLIYIRDFLGHESVETTQIYARSNPESARKAIEKVQAETKGPELDDWRKSPDVMNMLHSL